MPSHQLQKDLDAALEQATTLVATDVKDTTTKVADGDEASDDKDKRPTPTAAKSKPARKRKATTPPKRQKKVAPSNDSTTKKKETQEAAPAENQGSEPSVGSKPEDTPAATPKKKRRDAQKKDTPQKLKTPKTTPRKARKKKYQASSFIAGMLS